MKNNQGFIGKYYKIISLLIKKSFPNLRDKKIKVYEKKSLKFSADTKKSPWKLRIRTNPLLRKYSDKLLIGVFSHELCHLEAFVEQSWFEYYFLRDFKKLSDKFIKKEEEETDKKVIRKGYGYELYLQRRYRWNTKDKKIKKLKKFYISPNKIKVYAKSIGKWKTK